MTGGTGVTGRDVTPRAFEQVFEKKIDGFGELFRWISFQKVGTSTIQSRAVGGVAGGTYLFALPGSPSACRDGWDKILKHQLDNRFRPCNLTELMPRALGASEADGLAKDEAGGLARMCPLSHLWERAIGGYSLAQFVLLGSA